MSRVCWGSVTLICTDITHTTFATLCSTNILDVNVALLTRHRGQSVLTVWLAGWLASCDGWSDHGALSITSGTESTPSVPVVVFVVLRSVATNTRSYPFV